MQQVIQLLAKYGQIEAVTYESTAVKVAAKWSKAD